MKRETPDILRLTEALADFEVRYVLAGSVAAMAWGSDGGVPGDLDIIPSTDEINLRRLTDLLHALKAEKFPATGIWVETPNGATWQEYAADDPRRDAVPAVLDPHFEKSFDSLFATVYGTLDIVPAISGRYEDLLPRTTRLSILGGPMVSVMSIEDLLAQLTVPRRKKDVSRVSHLRALQRQVADN